MTSSWICTCNICNVKCWINGYKDLIKYTYNYIITRTSKSQFISEWVVCCYKEFSSIHHKACKCIIRNFQNFSQLQQISFPQSLNKSLINRNTLREHQAYLCDTNRTVKTEEVHLNVFAWPERSDCFNVIYSLYLPPDCYCKMCEWLKTFVLKMEAWYSRDSFVNTVYTRLRQGWVIIYRSFPGM